MKRNIVLVLFFMMMSSKLNAFEAEGRAQNREQSLSNSHIAAHFTCNREGLWADLDNLRVVSSGTQERGISGSRKKITEYVTRVEFSCKAEYQRYPNVLLQRSS